MGYRITDDIEKLKAILPLHILKGLEQRGGDENLIEVIMDLGRVPTARYVDGEYMVDNAEITREDIGYVVSRMRDFDSDNRAGMERTLHRISAIRNRNGDVVGLTFRVGRAVYGTIEIIKDIILSGQSVLLLGPPGVGKTTMLRESARVLAEEKRVVIVDTSNEIGGDGDVPHPAIGRARRMQVAQPSMQHEVMIEGVENHNPQVIVIDEIGRELEAQAARTIAERGVQLVGTAHGNTLDNLLRNPTLSDLVGGVESVTLSDDEARRRGTQKTVLERRAAPTFDVLIEIQSRDRLLIWEDVAAAVDAHLRGFALPAELRYRDGSGQVQIETVLPARDLPNSNAQDAVARRPTINGGKSNRNGTNGNGLVANTNHTPASVAPTATNLNGENAKGLKPLTVFAYGIARNRLAQSAKRLNVPLTIVDDVEDANVLVTLKNYYRQRPRLIVDAERMGISVYVMRANSVTQMEDFISDVFNLEGTEEEGSADAMREVEDAIRQVRVGKSHIDLKPQPPHLRRLQHEVVEQAKLTSHSYGIEPNRYVRVFQSDPAGK